MDAQATVLKALVKKTEDLLSKPSDSDTFLQLLEKSCHRRKVEIPFDLSSLNTAMVSQVYCWPYLLSEERATAVHAIHGWLRGQRFPQPHLVEEICLLLVQMLNILALAGKAPTVKPKALLEGMEPLQKVLEGKLAYLLARKDGGGRRRTSRWCVRKVAFLPGVCGAVGGPPTGPVGVAVLRRAR